MSWYLIVHAYSTAWYLRLMHFSLNLNWCKISLLVYSFTADFFIHDSTTAVTYPHFVLIVQNWDSEEPAFPGTNPLLREFFQQNVIGAGKKRVIPILMV